MELVSDVNKCAEPFTQEIADFIIIHSYETRELQAI